MALCAPVYFSHSGQLIAAINVGKARLARTDLLSGALVGVSVDLAQGFAWHPITGAVAVPFAKMG